MIWTIPPTRLTPRHPPLHKGGKNSCKRPPCAGIRFRIPRASCEAGGGLLYDHFAVISNRQCDLDNPPDTANAVPPPFAQGGLLKNRKPMASHPPLHKGGLLKKREPAACYLPLPGLFLFGVAQGFPLLGAFEIWCLCITVWLPFLPIIAFFINY